MIYSNAALYYLFFNRVCEATALSSHLRAAERVRDLQQAILRGAQRHWN